MKKILVIEDQPEMRRSLETTLEMEGFEVLLAEDGRMGLELALAARPDLILCDVMMPGMDGHGLLQVLRADNRTAHLPFIFLTARADKQDARTGMNLGADDYLTKPVAKSDLLAAISSRLQRAEVQKRRLDGKRGEFKPDFSSPAIFANLGLSRREAEVLLWVAQGKSNGDIADILGLSEFTVKRHMAGIFDTLGVQSRNAAMLRALESMGSER
ncbi:response regulator transcription factor [Pedosphaera parvula]|uniref:Two component transcriptional regulator, LuxR family n=1 Tax=Pedosphaera parvula (strain Ellin514) TaxID=320771 RepID=B9XBJ2_PEDPL|nr:response regulator transcription factor [Pedosphaera parvula]EEF62877.1 two component transcriptional regulator, LuxR family [Pedosphaera parvula Ellin514]